MASCLGDEGEVDAANHLLDEASTCVGDCKEVLVYLKLTRAKILNYQMLEALGFLQATLPEAKELTDGLYCETLRHMVDVLICLGRYQEAYDRGTELIPSAKAKLGLEHQLTLKAITMHGRACAELGRGEEAKANLECALTTQTRVLGRDHFDTQGTLHGMRAFGFAEPSG